MRKMWNRPTLSVWSLVTTDSAGKANMNICTYVSAVSMEPKLMTIAVYRNTKTLQNLEENPQASVLLQLLTEPLAPVVRVCGQLSGQTIDKIARLQKRYRLLEDSGLPYFAESAGFLILHNPIISDVNGDHMLYTFSVAKHKNLNGDAILTTDLLRAKKIIR